MGTGKQNDEEGKVKVMEVREAKQSTGAWGSINV